VVVSVSDPVIARKIARAAYEYEGPVYIRMEYENASAIHSPELTFEIGKGYCVREGKDITIATYGIALARAMDAAQTLAKEGIDAEVLDLPTLKPFDHDLLLASVGKTGALVTLEDHNVIGGLASVACQTLIEAHLLPIFRALGIQDHFTESGKNDELRRKYGIDAAAVVRAAREVAASCGGRPAREGTRLWTG
jgi:transketolase